jgi:hypothetical protein
MKEDDLLALGVTLFVMTTVGLILLLGLSGFLSW